jgi:hypothetical protein
LQVFKIDVLSIGEKQIQIYSPCLKYRDSGITPILLNPLPKYLKGTIINSYSQSYTVDFKEVFSAMGSSATLVYENTLILNSSYKAPFQIHFTSSASSLSLRHYQLSIVSLIIQFGFSLQSVGSLGPSLFIGANANHLIRISTFIGKITNEYSLDFLRSSLIILDNQWISFKYFPYIANSTFLNLKPSSN